MQKFLNAEVGQEWLFLLSHAANSEGGLNIAAHKSVVQHVQKAQKVIRTTEEDVEIMDSKFQRPDCERKSRMKIPLQLTADCTANPCPRAPSSTCHGPPCWL